VSYGLPTQRWFESVSIRAGTLQGEPFLSALIVRRINFEAFCILLIDLHLDGVTKKESWFAVKRLAFLICVNQDDVIFSNGSTRKKPDLDHRVLITERNQIPAFPDVSVIKMIYAYQELP